MSGVSFFALDTEQNPTPRYKSTAEARGLLTNPDTGEGIPNSVGAFTLWREGIVVFTARAMTVNVALGVGWCSCRILHTELAQHGLYQWEMVLTSPDGLWVLTDTGDFTL